MNISRTITRAQLRERRADRITRRAAEVRERYARYGDLRGMRRS